MTPEPAKEPGRVVRAYEALVSGLSRVLVDIVSPVTAFVIIYFILFGKVTEPAIALMLGGIASGCLGLPIWTRQDRKRRNRDDDDDPSGGITISIGRGGGRGRRD